MSNTTDNRHGPSATHAGPSCRVAYTLNNGQPVRCSYIDDQPLFFMDFEDEADIIEDEGFFDFTMVEDGVAALSEYLASCERSDAVYEVSDSGERFSRFLDTMKAITRPRAEQGEVHEDIKFLEKTLRQSRLGGAYIDFAAQYGTVLRYDRQIEGAVYDRKSGAVLINPDLCREDRILLAARELRRVWQHRNGVLLNPLVFQPDQAILVNRAQIADLCVAAVRIAWELQLAGEKGAWERLEQSSMADLAHAFARESFMDFRTLNNGIAQCAVFESWFLSERCRHEDRRLIRTMLADYQGYVFDMEQSSRNVTADLMTALGNMPFGKNYLAPHAGTIIGDAIFTEVRDRSNANFLWFIKFERSFRETEQELQTGGTVTGRDDLRGLQKNKNTRFGDHEQEAHIIPLPQGGDDAAPAQAGTAEGSGGNIIPFRRGSVTS